MLTEFFGEETRLELSCVTIRVIGIRTAMTRIGKNTATVTTMSENTNTFRNTIAEKVKPNPEGMYMMNTMSVEKMTDGINVSTMITNISQKAVLNSILKSAPKVI